MKACMGMKANIATAVVSFYLLVSAPLLQPTPSTSKGSSDVDAAVRAELTLNGLFHYFWKSDPKSGNIRFFFACGQIGGAGGENASQCSCVQPDSCTNCYRWWDALAMESVASYGIYMSTKNHSDIADLIFSHSPYNNKFDGAHVCTYVDDFVWYGLAYLRFYEWLGVSVM